MDALGGDGGQRHGSGLDENPRLSMETNLQGEREGTSGAVDTGLDDAHASHRITHIPPIRPPPPCLEKNPKRTDRPFGMPTPPPHPDTKRAEKGPPASPPPCTGRLLYTSPSPRNPT